MPLWWMCIEARIENDIQEHEGLYTPFFNEFMTQFNIWFCYNIILLVLSKTTQLFIEMFHC